MKYSKCELEYKILIQNLVNRKLFVFLQKICKYLT